MLVKMSFCIFNHYFYIHNRHLGWILGVCYAGKTDVFFESCSFTCITGMSYGCYAGKSDDFCLEIALLPGKTIKDHKKTSENGSPSMKLHVHRMQRRAQRTLKAAQGYRNRLHGRSQGPPAAPLGSLLTTLDALLESNLVIWMRFSIKIFSKSR